MKLDLPKLRDAALEAAHGLPGGGQVEDIVFDANEDEYGLDILRVVVKVKALERAQEIDLEGLLHSIEGAITAVDERFPSVRFADAA